MRVRVATMPEGEDPDTLVRRGGADALEPLVHDAMDVLERKLQLLQQRGWFEGVEHQREALDRLLPTIRATADPIMRELYLKAVSERTGVSREVLQQQAAARAPGVAAGEGRRAPPEEGRHGPAGPGMPRARTARRRHEDLSAERDLLRVVMRDRAWLARAAEEVPPEWFETAPLREVYESLRRSPENVGSGLFLEQLSPAARRAWAWLDSIEAKYGVPDPDVTYVGAVRTLEVRPLRRRRSELTRRLRQSGLAPQEQDELIRERRRLDDEISTKYPEERMKRHLRRGDVDAR
jgi:DNA primase